MQPTKPKPIIIRLTERQFRDADNESMGYCLACAAEAYGVEPDARRYECEECDAPRVYGASELLIMGRIEIIDDDSVGGKGGPL